MLKPIISVVSICLFLTNSSLFAETIRNIDYVGDGNTQHKLDIYIPSGAGPFPAVIHYPGMGFSNGNSKSDGGLSNSYNSAGFIVVAPNLSGNGAATYPTQLNELKATVRFLRANASVYKLDPDFIGVIGFSSGAWNSVILATTGDVDEYTVGNVTMKLEGTLGGNLEYSSRVQAAWAAAAPTQFLSMDSCGGSMIKHDDAGSPESGMIGGPIQQNKEKATLANPITFVSKDDPPIHLAHGTADNLVPFCQSKLLYDALLASENQKEMTLAPNQGGGHSPDFNGSLDFFKKALAANKEGCLDLQSPKFDPLATYCNNGDCCEETATVKISSSVDDVLSIGYSRVNKSAETISISSRGRHTTQIFNASGARIMSQSGQGKKEYNLRGVKSGVYIVKIFTDKTSITRNIVRF